MGRPSEDSFARLDGRTALVTGASSGIGRAIAIELGRAGADVIVHCARSVERAESVAAEIAEYGHAEVILADFRDPEEQLEQFVENVIESHPRLSILVHCAGVDVLTGAAKDWSFAEKLEALHRVDVRAGLHLCRRFGDHMRQAGSAAIVTIGWDQAATGMEGDSGELFAMAKGAVMSYTRSLALSLAPEVRINCIAPGWIRTAWGEQAGAKWQQRVVDETPLKRWGETTDIAALARFLVSDEAAYLTGQVINANGGAVR